MSEEEDDLAQDSSAQERVRDWLRSAPPVRIPVGTLARNEAWLASLSAPTAAPAPVAAGWTWLVPAGMVAMAAAGIAVWFAAAGLGAAARPIPIQPLLAAHFRYSTDGAASQGNLVAANYSDGWAFDETETDR